MLQVARADQVSRPADDELDRLLALTTGDELNKLSTIRDKVAAENEVRSATQIAYPLF